MKPNKFLTYLEKGLTRLTRREDGSSTIELAIVFPILLLVFAGTAELGRLLYTYTTLAKATAVGARYLSASRDAVNGTADQKAAALQKAKNLVVCGTTNTCDGQTPVVTGLTTSNVLICDNFSTACSPALSGGPVKYFRVEIQDYTFSAGIFNVAIRTGQSTESFYFPLKPGTEARSMQ